MCKCGSSGVLVAEVMPGMIMFQPCGCPAAAYARERAERELAEMLVEVRRMLREAG